MRRRRRPTRAPVVLAVLLLAALGATFLASTAASASPALAVAPSSGLTNGQSVVVSGSGFAANSTGAVIECNNASLQPTVTVLGNAVPVSCTNPLSGIKTTSSGGDLGSSSFTVATGVVGPPGAGTDTGGNSAATDAANFPCPPTAAQITAGDSCVIAFGDQAGDQVTFPISFSTSSITTTSTTGTSSTTTTTGSTTTTTAAPATTTTTTTTTASATSGTVPGQLPGFLTVVAGQSTMIQGRGFKPGETVTAAIHSTAIQVGTFTANAIGVASGTIMIPFGTVVGYHEIYLTGATSGHIVIIPAWIITGEPATLASSTSNPAASGGSTSGGSTTEGAPTSSRGSLAYTGAGRGVWVTLAGGLLLLDLGYLLVTMFLRPRELLARRANRRMGSIPTK